MANELQLVSPPGNVPDPESADNPNGKTNRRRNLGTFAGVVCSVTLSQFSSVIFLRLGKFLNHPFRGLSDYHLQVLLSVKPVYCCQLCSFCWHTVFCWWRYCPFAQFVPTERLMEVAFIVSFSIGQNSDSLPWIWREMLQTNCQLIVLIKCFMN